MANANNPDASTKSGSQAFNLNLPRQALFSIADAANVRIACAQGSIWITLDNDLRDIVLDDCQEFTTTEHRRALIYAMKPSQISIAPVRSASLGGRADSASSGLVLQMQPA